MPFARPLRFLLVPLLDTTMVRCSSVCLFDHYLPVCLGCWSAWRVGAKFQFITNIGDKAYFLTSLDAPKNKIVSITLVDNRTPNAAVILSVLASLIVRNTLSPDNLRLE
jgi:hypothetical protein